MFEVELIEKLKAHFPNSIIDFLIPRTKRLFIRMSKEDLKEVTKFLVNEGFTHLLAITAIDIGDNLEVLYHLSGNGIITTIRIILPETDDVIPSITDIIPGALLHEREVHDLFGIKFEGNQDLKPLILPEEWPKDLYPMRKRK